MTIQDFPFAAMILTAMLVATAACSNPTPPPTLPPAPEIQATVTAQVMAVLEAQSKPTEVPALEPEPTSIFVPVDRDKVPQLITVPAVVATPTSPPINNQPTAEPAPIPQMLPLPQAGPTSTPEEEIAELRWIADGVSAEEEDAAAFLQTRRKERLQSSQNYAPTALDNRRTIRT